jgi:glutathione synthase/RimK-type ligase-like ATP-grasp enzyme
LRFAILVPSPDYAAEWRWAFEPEAAPLRAAGASVDAIAWTAGEDFGGYDLVLPLVAWGYHQRFGDWLTVLDRFERERIPVANPVEVLRWNGDKAYLAELAGNGVATVPSLAFASFGEHALARAREEFGCSELVVKPTISASAYGTYRVGPNDPVPEAVRGWRMLVQPWIEAIVDSGEWSLIYFDGAFSHAVSKVPVEGEFRVQPEYGGIIARCEPPEGARELAEAVLAAAPAPTIYARIDIVAGNGGELQVIELELIEPALFLAEAPEAGAAFARAVLSAAERARK